VKGGSRRGLKTPPEQQLPKDAWKEGIPSPTTDSAPKEEEWPPIITQEEWNAARADEEIESEEEEAKMPALLEKEMKVFRERLKDLQTLPPGTHCTYEEYTRDPARFLVSIQDVKNKAEADRKRREDALRTDGKWSKRQTQEEHRPIRVQCGDQIRRVWGKTVGDVIDQWNILNLLPNEHRIFIGGLDAMEDTIVPRGTCVRIISREEPIRKKREKGDNAITVVEDDQTWKGSITEVGNYLNSVRTMRWKRQIWGRKNGMAGEDGRIEAGDTFQLFGTGQGGDPIQTKPEYPKMPPPGDRTHVLLKWGRNTIKFQAQDDRDLMEQIERRWQMTPDEYELDRKVRKGATWQTIRLNRRETETVWQNDHKEKGQTKGPENEDNQKYQRPDDGDERVDEISRGEFHPSKTHPRDTQMLETECNRDDPNQHSDNDFGSSDYNCGKRDGHESAEITQKIELEAEQRITEARAA
jgi:hypothetical protein